MKLVVPSEILENEHRVGITPDCVSALVKIGFKVFIQSNAGLIHRTLMTITKKWGQKSQVN